MFRKYTDKYFPSLWNVTMWSAIRTVNSFVKMSQTNIKRLRSKRFLISSPFRNTCCFCKLPVTLSGYLLLSSADLLFIKCIVSSFRYFAKELKTETSLSVNNWAHIMQPKWKWNTRVVFMSCLHIGSSLKGVLILDVSILYILKHLPGYVHSTYLSSIYRIHMLLFCDWLQTVILCFC